MMDVWRGKAGQSNSVQHEIRHHIMWGSGLGSIVDAFSKAGCIATRELYQSMINS